MVNRCSLCPLVISRATTTLLCSDCNTAYHENCCRPEWRVTPRLTICCRPLPTPTQPSSAVPATGAVSSDLGASPLASVLLVTPPTLVDSAFHGTVPTSLTRDCTTLIGQPQYGAKRLESPLEADSLRQSKLHCSSTPTTDSMADAPQWFTTFSNDLNANFVRIESKVNNLQSHVHSRQAELRAESPRITSLSRLVEKSLAATSDLRVELQAEICAIQSQRLESDTCEVILQGIPLSLGAPSENDEALVNTVLTKIGLPSLQQHVMRCQPWLPNAAPASMATSVGPRIQQSPTTRGIVFQLVSPTCRDLIVRNSHKLKDVTTASLFGASSSARISLHPLFPRSIHALFTRACERAKSLNYARPIIKNLTVFMRPGVNSTPISISLLSYLDGFSPAQASQLL